MNKPKHMEAQHMDLPYKIVQLGDEDFGMTDANGASVALIKEDGTGRAAFIVRACNSHYELLEALKLSRDLLCNKQREMTHEDVFKIAGAIKAAEQE